GAEKINLSWEANPPSASYAIWYEVFRDTAPIYDYRYPQLTPIITGLTSTSYQDPATLTPGTTYYYALKAYYVKNGNQIITTSLISKYITGTTRYTSPTPEFHTLPTATHGAATVPVE